jgi:hypothetical protein
MEVLTWTMIIKSSPPDAPTAAAPISPEQDYRNSAAVNMFTRISELHERAIVQCRREKSAGCEETI